MTSKELREEIDTLVAQRTKITVAVAKLCCKLEETIKEEIKHEALVKKTRFGSN